MEAMILQPVSKGHVQFVELHRDAAPLLGEFGHMPEEILAPILSESELVLNYFEIGNLVFNFPREQYAKLDRGETPEDINANWLTLSASAYTDPSVLTVTGEAARVQSTTVTAESNAKNSVFRFALDVGQFVGTWSTAILIGGSTASSTPGTGKIVAAVNNVKDDTGATLTRDGSTIHLVTWKLKHLDSSEV